MIECELALLLLTVGLPAGAGQARIVVRPSSEVADAQVTIGAIAGVECADADAARDLAAVPICPSPLAGASRRVSRDQIITALRRKGYADRSLDLLCPEKVAVTRAAAAATGQAMFEAAKEHVLANGTFAGAAVVEPVRLPADRTVPAGKLELRPRAGIVRPRKGRNTVPVDVVVDGRVHSTVYVSINARTFGKALTAARAIAKGQEISPVNAVLRDCELTSLPEDLMLELPSAASVAAVPIAAGQAIRRGWVAAVPVIKSGDAVTVVASGDFVSVSEKGTAASDGRVGDRIKIRLGSEQRTIRATVIGPGAVEIALKRRQ